MSTTTVSGKIADDVKSEIIGAGGGLSTSSGSSSFPKSESKKLNIHVLATPGIDNIPINKFRLESSKQIADLEVIIRNSLRKLQKHGSSSNSYSALYLYCGKGFSPTPDQTIQDLFDSFQVGGILVVHYGSSEQFG